MVKLTLAEPKDRGIKPMKVSLKPSLNWLFVFIPITPITQAAALNASFQVACGFL